MFREKLLSSVRSDILSKQLVPTGTYLYTIRLFDGSDIKTGIVTVIY